MAAPTFPIPAGELQQKLRGAGFREFGDTRAGSNLSEFRIIDIGWDMSPAQEHRLYGVPAQSHGWKYAENGGVYSHQ